MITGNEAIHPTFPVDGYGSSFHGTDSVGESKWCSNPGGMTYRQWLVGMIVSGHAKVGSLDFDDFACRAVRIADALIAELNKQP